MTSKTATLVGLIGAMICLAGLLVHLLSQRDRLDIRSEPIESTTNYENARGSDSVDVIHDAPHAVTCWVYFKGISCLPDSQVRRDGGP